MKVIWKSVSNRILVPDIHGTSVFYDYVCPCPDCQYCKCSAPISLMINLFGSIGASNCNATDCSSTLGSYEVTQYNELLGEDPCVLSNESDPPVVACGYLVLRLTFLSNMVEIVGGVCPDRFTPCGDQFVFQKALSSPYDCIYDITGIYSGVSQNPITCDYTSLQLSVTLPTP